MKTSDGMVRSAEVMKNKPPVVAHIEIHPALAGGVRVEHHHTEPMMHPPKVHKFGNNDEEKFLDHIAKHTSKSFDAGEPDEDDEQNSGAENEVGEDDDGE
ncbi:MAG: hypothetical protein ACRD2O_00035 [Terriglobia bacterium]